jgi:hypothetical protein
MSVVHKDIRKKFEARSKSGEVRRYEAVGFLNQGESWVSGDTMLERVPDAIGEEDGKFLDECVDQDWSRELFPYYLATNWRGPDYPRYVRYFSRGGGRWHRFWSGLGSRWGGSGLVVRRCA